MSNAANERVTVCQAMQEGETNRKEYVVYLDGTIVLRTGGKSQFDYCEAASFAKGLILGLEKAS
jgi:hypothetical protein